MTGRFYSSIALRLIPAIILLAVCILTETRATAAVAKRTIEVNQPYLHLPVRSGAEKKKLELYHQNRLAAVFDVELDADHPQHWMYLDLSMWKGSSLELRLHGVPEDSPMIAALKPSDKVPGHRHLYREHGRPQFHFTARRGWLNDPNGLIYYRGKYHLYFQYNPCGIGWGNMSWGHAVSDDLVHWRELSPCMYPNEQGACFTGAAFVDRQNMLGLKTGAEDVLVMFYLRTLVGLSYAYSNDAGRTLTQYEHNPVLTHAGARIDSPKPFWHEPTRRWVAPTFDHIADPKNPDKRVHSIVVYSSSDLKTWQRESDVGPVGILAECPDLFELPVDGDPNNRKWLMVFGDGSYLLGDFDGKTLWLGPNRAGMFKDRIGGNRFGGNFYAPQTYSNIPRSDGRRIQIGWMRHYGDGGPAPFNQQMTVPYELTLRTTDEGVRLFTFPVKELQRLRQKKHSFKNLVLREETKVLQDVEGGLFDIEAEIEVGQTGQFGLSIRGATITYDMSTRLLWAPDGKTTFSGGKEGLIRLRVLVDRASLEVFLDDGRLYAPLMVSPRYGDDHIRLFARRGSVRLKSLVVHELKSIWPEPPGGSPPPLPASKAQASSIYSFGYEPELAFDGSFQTRWCSSRPYGKPDWVQVDLEKVVPIRGVRLHWEGAYAKGYRLMASEDGKTWQVIHETSDGRGGVEEIKGLSGQGRFLRVDCRQRATEHGFSLWEVEILEE